MEELVTQLLSSVSGVWKYRSLAVAGVIGWASVTTLPDDCQSTAPVFVATQSILPPLLSGMATFPSGEQQTKAQVSDDALAASMALRPAPILNPERDPVLP